MHFDFFVRLLKLSFSWQLQYISKILNKMLYLSMPNAVTKLAQVRLPTTDCVAYPYQYTLRLWNLELHDIRAIDGHGALNRLYLQVLGL